MQPILLATDGSPSANEATREAIELAQALRAPLVVVAVEHVTAPAYGYYGYGEVYAELRHANAEHLSRVIANVEVQAEEVGVPCTSVIGDGPVVDEILRVAHDRKVRLIVIGAHGWGPVRRLVFGSVSLGVLHHAECPVLVARSLQRELGAEPGAAAAGAVHGERPVERSDAVHEAAKTGAR